MLKIDYKAWHDAFTDLVDHLLQESNHKSNKEEDDDPFKAVFDDETPPK